MINKTLRKITYWKNDEYEDNLYYVQFEYDKSKYAELKLITEEELNELKNTYEDIIEEYED